MIYRRLGKSGLNVSLLSYGAWVTFATQMPLSTARKCMEIAYDAGVNFFDNAETYANGQAEIVMGKILKQTAWRRDSYIISSKAYFGSVPDRRPTQVGLSRKHLVEACHQALQRMRLDYLDLYFCHRPDPDTPVSEVVETMTNLIRQGKILYWGSSEWPASDIKAAHVFAKENSLVGPSMEQPQYNMIHRNRVEEEYASLYENIGLGLTIWSPLASGFLTGKYNDGIPAKSRLSLQGYEWLRKALLGPHAEQNITALRKLEKIATSLGTRMSHLAIAWCAKNQHVSTVITGSSTLEQTKANMTALDILPKMDDDIMKQISNVLSEIKDSALGV